MQQNAQSVLLLMLAAGCVLGSVAVWRQTARKLRAKQPALPMCECPRTAPSLMSVPLSVVIWIVAPVVAAGIIVVDPEHPLHRVQVLCFSNALILLILPPIITASGLIPPSQFGIGLARWKRDTIDGALGFLASVLPVGLVLAATYHLRSPETQHPLLKLLREHPGAATTLWIALGALVLAPLAEELVYRVVLQGWLQSKIEPVWAISAVAVLFAFVHGWPDSLPLIPLSLILGYVYYRRHSYLAVVVLHMLFNATNLALAMLTQHAETLKSAAGL